MEERTKKIVLLVLSITCLLSVTFAFTGPAIVGKIDGGSESNTTTTTASQTSTTTKTATSTSTTTTSTTTTTLIPIPEFKCGNETSVMGWDECVGFCKSYGDKPLQLESEEQAQKVLQFIRITCPGDKLWMGYKSKSTLIENKKRKGRLNLARGDVYQTDHYWIDEGLQLSSPVPESHRNAFDSVGCEYFNKAEGSKKDHIPYFKLSNPEIPDLNRSSEKIECKVHDLDDHEHNCLCMRHIHI